MIRQVVLTSFAAALAVGLAPRVSATETVTYTYDALGRLVVVKSTGTVNNNNTHSYCYDKAGNRITYNSSQTGMPSACATVGT